jgi:hypothetical protein
LPVQSHMPAPSAAQEALAELAAHTASLDAASGGNLLECFASVPDPRDARGVRHSLASVLALCTAAVLCGHASIEDVTAWVAAAPRQVLAAAGYRRNGLCVPLDPDTVVRIFSALGAQSLAACTEAFLARRARQGPVAFPVASPGWLPAIAADGKAMRGAIGQDGQVPYLLAAAVHGTGTVIAERLIGPKTNEVPENEVPEIAPLLRELNQYYCLARHVSTLDALHTVRAHAAVRGHRDRARPPRAPDHPGHGRSRRDQEPLPSRPAGCPDRALRHPQGPQAPASPPLTAAAPATRSGTLKLLQAA